MKTRKLCWWMFLVASFGFALQISNVARAQDNADADPSVQSQDQGQDQNPEQDPPGRVARLNFSEGAVSFRPAGEDDWVIAVPNRPMVTGDDLWTDENSRAEVHIGSAAIRMSAKTGITFLALDDHATQIRLAQGSIILRVRHLDDDESYEIDTPNIAFSLLQPGEYRVDVSEDGSQTITDVWHGRGRVTGGGLSYTVVAGQSATFTGNDQHVDYDLAQIPHSDGFDDWAFQRDDREDQADSANYVSREMTGYEDLDENGDWSYVAGYGPCWRPRAVSVGWAPYRFGHWAFVGSWGWTWVEDEPWGFAPFHYGRWASVNGGWFWVPGPVVVRPIWAPALVAFVGGGPGFHFSAGVGVGWFPLAPGEVYLPGYHVSRAYVNNVNITNTTVNVTNVTNVYNTVIVNKTTNITYVNQRVNNGVTVVSHDTFVNARPVGGNLMRVDAREVAAAPVTHFVAAEPVRTSVMGAGRPVPGKPPAAVISRPVVAVRTPPLLPRPIEQRQIQAGGHLNEQALVHPVGPARPVPMNQTPMNQTPMNQNTRTQTPAQTQEGFRPFTPPNNGYNGNNGNNGGNNNNQVRTMQPTQPRTYERQGTPQPENRNVAPQENRTVPPNPNYRPSQPQERPTPQETHPLVRPAPPVQERSPQQEQQQEQKFNQWHAQRPASPPPASKPAPKAPEPKPSKKGR